MAGNFPILDGVEPSFADIAIRVKPDGGSLVDIVDIVSINTATSLEIGETRGPGGWVRKRTSGRPSQEASMTLWRSGWQTFLRDLKALAPVAGGQRRISLVHFTIYVAHALPAPNDAEIWEYRIKSCRVAGRTINAAEGSEAQQVEVPLSTSQIADVIDGEEVIL